MKDVYPYYHYLTLRTKNGFFSDEAIGSVARTLDEATHERMKITAQYHPYQIAALTTHNIGTGPACR